jgi:hypothetical protein
LYIVVISHIFTFSIAARVSRKDAGAPALVHTSSFNQNNFLETAMCHNTANLKDLKSYPQKKKPKKQQTNPCCVVHIALPLHLVVVHLLELLLLIVEDVRHDESQSSTTRDKLRITGLRREIAAACSI